LLVKNMVCRRCVMTVEDILNKANIKFDAVQLGEIHLHDELPEAKRDGLSDALQHVGFELIDNRSSGLVEKIKQLTIKKARNEVGEAEQKQNLSTYLSAKLHHEYTYLSSLFSSVEGRTIESFFIHQRIEKAKELLVYNDKTLSEIADALDYSSVAHLSAQFKKITGLTPSHFKQIGTAKRKTLDGV
jgi:AraC family transcriptional regulator